MRGLLDWTEDSYGVRSKALSDQIKLIEFDFRTTLRGGLFFRPIKDSFMHHLRSALEGIAPLSRVMEKVIAEPVNGLWFRHTSPYELRELTPSRYDQLVERRGDYDVGARRNTERRYHRMLKTDTNNSFLYATVVGYHKMEDVLSYPGFTYFFQLKLWQVAGCIFDIVDEKKWMEPTKGMGGLGKAREIWEQHAEEFKPYEEDGLGIIDPRIEVIIPFPVVPTKYVPQEEDR